jgi:hypothetical protein
MADELKFEDKTGQPRSVEELKEALSAVQKEFITNPFGSPNLSIHYPTIMEALTLLIRVMEAKQP